MGKSLAFGLDVNGGLHEHIKIVRGYYEGVKIVSKSLFEAEESTVSALQFASSLGMSIIAWWTQDARY